MGTDALLFDIMLMLRRQSAYVNLKVRFLPAIIRIARNLGRIQFGKKFIVVDRPAPLQCQRQKG